MTGLRFAHYSNNLDFNISVANSASFKNAYLSCVLVCFLFHSGAQLLDFPLESMELDLIDLHVQRESQLVFQLQDMTPSEWSNLHLI